MTTLADKSLLSGGDNKPLMLEKHLYDSWKSKMELYMMNRPHGRMILASVEKGPLVWPTITVDGETRLKEYTELTPAETIQADRDIKAINIKLKERIKSLSGKMDKDKIKQDLEEIETINIELDHRVTKIIAENEHLKQTYKQLYGLIKQARIRSKEQCDDLINQVNLKSVEISDLNASLQEKVLVITALKDDLRKLKGKALVDNDVTKHPSDPEMLKIGVEIITSKLLNKRTAHSAYIKHTQEEATVIRDLVEHVKSKYPLDQSLESAYRYAKQIQELLTNISKTCPSINNADGKLVAVTPKNKDKRVRFTEHVTYSGNTNTKTSSSSNLVSNKPMLSSTGVKPSTIASGSQPSGNTKKDKIQQTPSSTQKNKVEAHPRKVKSSLKNKDCVVEHKRTAHVQHSKLNANFKLECVKWKVSSISIGGSISFEGFLSSIMLLVVIIVMVVFVVVVLVVVVIAIVGVVIVVVFGIIVVVGGVSSIFKLSFLVLLESLISCRMAAKVMVGVSDVDVLLEGILSTKDNTGYDKDGDNDANGGNDDEREIILQNKELYRGFNSSDGGYIEDRVKLAGGLIGSGDEGFPKELKELLPDEAGK
ncbi:hypothetical protein Tco_0583225 [Tanacetum coccineum]